MVADAHFKFKQRWCPRCRQLLSDDDDNGLCDVNDIILLFFLAYILSIPKCKAEQFLLWYLFCQFTPFISHNLVILLATCFPYLYELKCRMRSQSGVDSWLSGSIWYGTARLQFPFPVSCFSGTQNTKQGQNRLVALVLLLVVPHAKKFHVLHDKKYCAKMRQTKR